MKSYMKIFNAEYNMHANGLSENLMTYLALICSSGECLKYNTMESAKFYSHLHNVMSKQLNNNPTALLHCLNILGKAVKNSTTKDVLVNKFRYVPVVARLLQQFPNNSTRLMQLLEDMTIGIHIESYEPYLEDLLNFLVENIQQDNDNSELALSVLVNICHKNVSTIYLLLRKIRSSTFLRSIMKFNLLAYKLYIILGDKTDMSCDLTKFIELSFGEIESILSNWNFPKLRHMVDFILDAEYHFKAIHEKFNGKRIENFINKVSARMSMEVDSQDESDVERQEMSIALLMELFEFFLKNSEITRELQTSVMNLALKWIKNDCSGIKAMAVIKQIIEMNLTTESHINFESLLNTIPHLTAEIESRKFSNEFVIAFLDLVCSMVKFSDLKESTFNAVTGSFLEKLVAHIFSPTLSSSTVSTTNIRLFVHVLLVLKEFSELRSQDYHEQLHQLILHPNTVLFLAKAFNLKDENLLQILFELLQISALPKKLLSQAIAGEHTINVNTSRDKIIKKTEVHLLSEAVEQKLDDVLEKMSKSNNLLVSEVAENYQYKLDNCRKLINTMKEDLQAADIRITHLQHQNEILNSIVVHDESKDFAKNIKIENLMRELESSLDENKRLRDSCMQFNKKMEIIDKNYKDLERNSESLRKELLNKLEQNMANHEKEIISLKKSMKTYKENLAEKENILEIKTQKLEKQSHELAELRKQSEEMNSVLSTMRKEIENNQETIKKYAEEIKETEQMRQVIMGVINKKPRK